jgi:hypothetical protein
MCPCSIIALVFWSSHTLTFIFFLRRGRVEGGAHELGGVQGLGGVVVEGVGGCVCDERSEVAKEYKEVVYGVRNGSRVAGSARFCLRKY